MTDYTGTRRSDTFVIRTATDIAAGDVFDGLAGNDRILFQVGGTFDLTRVTLRSIEQIVSFGSAPTVILTGAQAAQMSKLIVGRLELTGGGTITLACTGTITTIALAQRTTLDLSAAHFSEQPRPQIEGSAGDDVLIGSARNDFFRGRGGNDVADGGAGSDTLVGDAGDDQLTGGAGNDLLSGGVGVDRMFGGAGNDEFHIAGPTDVAAGDLYDGGDGHDTLSLFTGFPGVYDLSTSELRGIEELTFGYQSAVALTAAQINALTTVTGELHLVGGGTVDATGKRFIGEIRLDDTGAALVMGDSLNRGYGGAGADTITGGRAANTIEGAGGDDILAGGAGNDTLSGGDGHDTLGGDAGDDQLDGGNGDDQLSGGDGGDVLTGEAGDDSLSGGGGADTLNGGSGDDLLDGGTGADILAGAAGNDVYLIDSAGDSILEYRGLGRDEVRASIDYTLPDDIEILVLTGAARQGTGNAADNELTGGAGDDRLSGLGGADLLDGGAGADVMAGGSGDDRYRVDNAGDSVVEAAGAGTDTVEASVNHTLAANVENLVLIGAARAGNGNELANVVTGGTRNDVLAGLGGNDRLTGGAGADRLDGGDGDDRLTGGTGADTMTGGAGRDVFVFAPGDVSATLAGADRITDFDARTGDRLDLRALDAVAGTPAADRFAFIGTAAFSGEAGELRYELVGTSTIVSADTDGDGAGDLFWRLDGRLVLADTAFLGT